MLSDLATLLRDRYRQTDNDDDLAKYIKNDRNVSSLYPSGRSEHADPCTELAVGLHGRFVPKKDEADIDEAIELFKVVLELYPETNVDHSMLQNIRGLISWLAFLFVENRKTFRSSHLSPSQGTSVTSTWSC